MSDTEAERLKKQYKVIILGDGAVGKTSIIRRFTNDEFQQSYLQTVGVDWFIKTIVLSQDLEITLQIWDIGGQELGSKLLSSYIYGSNAIILVYDLTNYASYKNLYEWYELVCKCFGDKKPLVALMANKTDMSHLRTVKKELADKWALENKFLNFSVSAKNGDHIHRSFVALAATLAQVPLPKHELYPKVVKAQIVNHLLTDSQNEIEKNNIANINKTRKKKDCTIS
jgi:Ras-related protein Rab-28